MIKIYYVRNESCATNKTRWGKLLVRHAHHFEQIFSLCVLVSVRLCIGGIVGRFRYHCFCCYCLNEKRQGNWLFSFVRFFFYFSFIRLLHSCKILLFLHFVCALNSSLFRSFFSKLQPFFPLFFLRVCIIKIYFCLCKVNNSGCDEATGQ